MAVTIVSQVVKAAASYDLTDIATVKDELSIKPPNTGNDAWLARAITQVSAAVANYCNRVFQVETVIDTIDLQRDFFPYQVPGGAQSLQLSRWPVLAVTSLTECGNALTEGADFRIDYAKGIVYRLSSSGGYVVPWAAQPVVVSYSAGYFVNKAKTTNVPATPGPYTITTDNASAFVQDRGVVFADGTALVAVTGAPAVGQYMVAAGVYTFAVANQGASVTITANIQQIPADLVEATLRMITMRYKAKDRDPMLMSQTQPNLGDQRFWVGGQPGQHGTLPPEISGMLDGTYRVPVVS